MYGLFAGLSVFAMETEAQTTPPDSLEEEKPYWVQAMDNDSTANFLDAVEDFEEYWENHKAPEEDEGVPSSGTGEEEEAQGEYAQEYKRFIYWKMENKPFVRPDGSLPNKDEKLKIWKHLRK